ncbi:methyltransferase domain-containing protein [Modestobacter versicolor]|uniref:methyltransferase domain-containing protein n=1 Tax=Modestobacter versicolor TaxID=429133 RepID=UPI0034DF0359
MTDPVDYFGGLDSPLVRFKSRVSLKARRRMYEAFEAEFHPGREDTVIDVGVTPDETLVDSNAFEQFYPYKDRMTATSFEDASGLERRFPGLTFVQTSGAGLPFPDRTFTFAYSSAVLEHVGDRAAQRAFVQEIMRVADGFFIAVPNRWFVLELHTFLPVLHWLPKPVHRWFLRKLGKEFWAQEANLNLVGPKELRSLFPAEVGVQLYRHRLFGLTSNIVAYGRSPRPATAGAGEADQAVA